jgi:hypothetical protein
VLIKDLARDTVSFIGGWALTLHEVLRPEVRESVLLFAGTLIAVPGAAAGVTALRSRPAGTSGQRPESPEPESSPSSS